MESAYRTELIKGIPAAADNDIYNRQLVYACGYWLIRTIKQIKDVDLIDHEWICPSGPVELDSEWKPEENAFRPRIISRLDAFIACAETTNHLPKLKRSIKTSVNLSKKNLAANTTHSTLSQFSNND